MHSIYTAAHPLHIFNKLFGFSTFSVDTKNFTPQIKPKDVIFMGLGLNTNVVINCIYWLQFSSSTELGSAVITTSLPLVTFYQYLTNTSIMILSVLKRKQICKIFEIFNEIDEILEEKFKVKFSYENQRRKVRKVISSVVSIIVATVTACIVTEAIKRRKVNTKDEIFLFWCLCCGSVIRLDFTFLAIAVKMRYEKINEIIR